MGCGPSKDNKDKNKIQPIKDKIEPPKDQDEPLLDHVEPKEENKYKLILNNEAQLSVVAHIAFQDADIDKDGFVDVYELEKLMIQIAIDCGVDCPTKEDVQIVFEKLDTDKDGKLSYDEYYVLFIDVLKEMASPDEK